MMVENQTETQRSEKTIGFDAQLKELEELVIKLESGKLGLEASMDAYEKAMRLCASLDYQLTLGEQKLLSLRDGVITPFESENL